MSKTASVLLCLGLLAQTGLAAERTWKKQWIISALAMGAASFLDAHSSRGLVEANPLLRNSRGEFAAGRAAAFKAGATGGLLAVQLWLVRKDQRNYKASSFVNFSAAAALSGAAIHNLRNSK